MSAGTELRILGPFEIVRRGVSVPLGGTKQQALLAYLCLHANRHVPVRRLIDAMWGDAPPASARKNVQLYVSRIRKLVEGGDGITLMTVGDGYVLSVTPGQLDLDCCRRLWDRGQEYLRTGAVQQASALFHEAGQLWRGEALSGLATTVAMQAETARLEHLRISLLSDLFASQLHLGRNAEVIPDLVRLVALYPHQERLRGYLMTALWRSGQRDEALATYLNAYHLMVEDLGIQPGRHLQLLYQAILADEAREVSVEHSVWRLSSPERARVLHG
ncbi:hypothetical protein GCM10010260_12840 [Streptomyces filipinensis]|uniref:OmpR/PhoB-type domain-containing protein n=1 Tax=Streptomyces filipinensis TaxID=66887 RepID=A0A918M9X2_9ACTN|nr:hypothetical protein GCM10010260_12840 [Streptomyces filipinensis]